MVVEVCHSGNSWEAARLLVLGLLSPRLTCYMCLLMAAGDALCLGVQMQAEEGEEVVQWSPGHHPSVSVCMRRQPASCRRRR